MDDNYFEVEASTPLLPEQQASNLPQIDLEPPGPRPPSRRKRVTQIGLVLAAVVAVAVLLRSVIAPSSPTPGGPALAPQPTPAPPTALITSNINFGTVSINGKQQRGALPLFFVPRHTTYTITIDAPPFLSRTCTFFFTGEGPQISSPNGNCGVGSGTFPTITANGVTDAPVFVVEIDFSASDLPPDQQRQINALLAHAAATRQTTTVPAGSYIATGFNADGTITSRRVITSLRATAFQVASTHFGQYGLPCDGLICQLGGDPQQFTALTGTLWIVGVPVALRWRFTTSAGRVLSEVSYQVAIPVEELLAYSPDTGWSLSPQFVSGPLNAGSTIGALDCATGTMVAQQQTQSMSLGLSVYGGNGIEGCQVSLQDSGGTKRGTFIWRFGVLLAADDAGHRLLPRLPIAPAAEIKAVQG